MAPIPSAVASKPEKIGAGVLFCCKGEALVLLRNSKHNHNTWGLPGGNADREDDDLWQTAVREAKEEMTHMPEDFAKLGEVLTKRGKRLQKHYTVYVCALLSAKDAYKPELNEEHSEWKWIAIDELRCRTDVHPVVHLLLHSHWDSVQKMLEKEHEVQ